MRILRLFSSRLARWSRHQQLAVSLLATASLSSGADRFAVESEIQPHPLSAEESLSRMQIEDGLRIELVASEPLVADPVDIAFDEFGRMFVAEISGYNQPDASKPRSRIRVLEDTDGDGRMDRGTTLADNLDYAQGVLPMKGGVLVTTNSGLLFLRDTDGDGKADVNEVLFEVTKSINVDRQMASPRRGIDNAVYINLGLGKKDIIPRAAPERKLELTSNNLRYDPATGEITRASGNGQFGNTFDDWGRQFFSMNRNPALHAVIPQRFLDRNPPALLVKGDEDVAPAGGDGKVYPLKVSRTTATVHAGTFTAACGIGAYRGELLGADYVNNLFVCEPTGQLVSRWITSPSGASLQARRAHPGREFLASDDEWFRPVNITTGPDGALYIVDVYRRFIDGDRFFPPDYRAKNDMGAGSERGRIYRVVRKDSPQRRDRVSVPKQTSKRVPLLEHPNGWYRDTAQRLIVEAGDAAAVPALEAMLKTSRNAKARLHALWTLEGLRTLKSEHVRVALSDDTPGVVEHALWLAARFQTSDVSIRARVLALAGDRNARLRFAGLLVAGDLDDAEARRVLIRAAVHDAADRWIQIAILSAPVTQSGAFLVSLVNDGAFSETNRSQVELARRLAAVLAATGKSTELRPVFVALGDASVSRSGDSWKLAVVSGVAEGLRRQRDGTLPERVSALLNQPPPELADSMNGVRALVGSATSIVRDPARPMGERLAAIPMIEHLPEAEVPGLIGPLLQRREAPEIQKAALETLLRLNPNLVAKILYENLPSMGGDARTGAMQFLQTRPSELLKKIKEGTISASLVDPSARWLFNNHSSAEVRELAREIFGRTAGDRKALVAQYKAALADQTGSVERGHQLFLQACSVCHRFRGEGNDVGPDISDVRIKTAAMLLSDILDPSDTLEPRWESYSLRTKNGRTYTGIIASESNDAVVIRGIGGTDTIPRAQIEAYEPMGTSLMPQGLEALLTEPNMADLLAYLRSSHEGR